MAFHYDADNHHYWHDRKVHGDNVLVLLLLGGYCASSPCFPYQVDRRCVVDPHLGVWWRHVTGRQDDCQSYYCPPCGHLCTCVPCFDRRAQQYEYLCFPLTHGVSRSEGGVPRLRWVGTQCHYWRKGVQLQMWSHGDCVVHKIRMIQLLELLQWCIHTVPKINKRKFI